MLMLMLKLKLKLTGHRVAAKRLSKRESTETDPLSSLRRRSVTSGMIPGKARRMLTSRTFVPAADCRDRQAGLLPRLIDTQQRRHLTLATQESKR